MARENSQPRSVQPKEVNDVRLIEAGLALWVVAFVVIAITAGPGKLLATAFCGFLVGLWGYRYTKRRRAHLNL